jgi:hypothetical protein
LVQLEPTFTVPRLVITVPWLPFSPNKWMVDVLRQR